MKATAILLEKQAGLRKILDVGQKISDNQHQNLDSRGIKS
jgi:hypothetical protein